MSQALLDAGYEAVLDRRAKALAQEPSTTEERRLVCTVALVGAGSEVLGVPAQGVSEVVYAPPITPLPGLPAWLPGIVQFRGQVLCAVHLAQWLGIAEHAPARYLVVLESARLPLGLLVSAVSGFRDVYADELAPGLREGDRRRPVGAITRDLVSVLDLEALVGSPDLWLAGSKPSHRNDDPNAGA